MKHEKIEAGACDTRPSNLVASDQLTLSKNSPGKQSRTIPLMPSPESGESIGDWHQRLVREGYFERVEVLGLDGDLGPIELLADRGNGAPFLCVGFHRHCTLVWICPTRIPRGWGDPFKTFLLRPGQVASAEGIRYARALAEKMRDAANREAARRDRKKTAHLTNTADIDAAARAIVADIKAERRGGAL